MSDKQELLGDKVERLIEKTMPGLAKRAKKKGCGCAERKRKLNEAHKKLKRAFKR